MPTPDLTSSDDLRAELDRVHRFAVAAADQFKDAEYSVRDALGIDLALFHGGSHPEAVGTFLIAYDSTRRAIDVERLDRRSSLLEVADQWWSDPTHSRMDCALYGPPWFDGGPR
jgi:hypothetical protein